MKLTSLFARRRSVVLFLVIAVLATAVLLLVLSRPHSLPRQLELGEKYLTELDYENAVMAFTAAIEIDDRAEQAYWGRGQAYAALGQHEEAIADFSFILKELNPENSNAYLARGDEYTAVGRIEDARADYAKVQELDPTFSGRGDKDSALPDPAVRSDSLVWSVQPQSGFEVIGMVYFRGQGFDPQIAEKGRAVLADSVRNGSTVINDGRYAAIQDGRYGLLDLQGNWIAAPEYLSVSGSAVTETDDWDYPDLVYSLDRNDSVETTLDPQTGYYFTETFDDTGTLVPKACDPAYEGPSFWFTWDSASGASLLVDGMDWTYTVTPDKDFSRIIGVYPSDAPEQGNQALYRSGSLLSDFVFEDVRDFSGGLIAVKQNGKWGYADENGRLVIPCEYEALRTDNLYAAEGQSSQERAFAASCTEGYVVVYNGAQYALYDTQGKPVIDFGVLEALTEVHDGKLWAKQNGQWGVLDLEATLSA